MLAKTINWGQSNINLVNQKGKRLMGASSWWGTTNRQPPLASSPFDWKLMLLWPQLIMRTNKLFATLLLLLSCSLHASTLQGKVVGVADGDTITVLDATNTKHKIRLQGIDAPEKAQAFGQKSKQSLSQMVYNKQVVVEYQKKDKYGRTLGKVLHNGTDVCLEQIKLGMAWHYKQYKSDQPKEDRETYAQAELASRSMAVGIWKDKNPTPPWEFRKQNK